MSTSTGCDASDGRVADPHDRPRVVAVARADVDEEILELDLVVLVPLPRPSLLADRAGHAAVACHHLDALRQQHLRQPAADAAEVQEALVVDVRHREPDLVDVTDERERRAAGGPADTRDRGAERVGRDLGEALRGTTPDRRRLGLVAGRPGRGEQLAEQVGKLHVRASLSLTRAPVAPTLPSDDSRLSHLGLAQRAVREPALS